MNNLYNFFIKNAKVVGTCYFILILILLVVISENGKQKRELLTSLSNTQLQVESLENDKATLQATISELQDQATIYLNTLSDMKAYNAKLEEMIASLETDIATADFMINDLEVALAEINERLEAQELQNSTETTTQD